MRFNYFIKIVSQLENIQTEEEVRAIIHSELLDEYTHPRARLSITR